jgi:C-terminal processing protease CtpA/Prc
LSPCFGPHLKCLVCFQDTSNQATSSRLVDQSPQRPASSDNQHIYTNEPARSQTPVANSLQQPPAAIGDKAADLSVPMHTPQNQIINSTMRRIVNYDGFGLSISTPNSKSTNRIPVPFVTRVEPGSPAELAGLKENDQIVQINGKSTYEQTSEFIANSIKNSKDEVDLVISRDMSKVPQQQQQAQPKSAEPVRSTTPLNIIKSEMSMSSSKINTSLLTPELEQLVNMSSSNETKLPSDAPVPRLCRVRSCEPSLGFAVSGSKQYPGIFKVSHS